MRRDPVLTDKQRMQVAQVSGASALYGIGRERDAPRDEAVAELRAITVDPVVLGHVLGDYLHRMETESQGYAPVVELLRAAGADEGRAAEVLQWQRER